MLFKLQLQYFLGDAMDKNLPANAGDMGLIPGLGGLCVAEQLSLCATKTESVHHIY